MTGATPQPTGITQLLDQLAAGTIPLGQVVADFAARSWPPGPAAASTSAKAFERELDDPEPAPEGSWAEVEAAFAADVITDTQYAALFQARAAADADQAGQRP